jgi:hypothetical protein
MFNILKMYSLKTCAFGREVAAGTTTNLRKNGQKMQNKPNFKMDKIDVSSFMTSK